MKPILFNTDMVRAILDGRKTVTRRVVKPQPGEELAFICGGSNHGKWGYSPYNKSRYEGHRAANDWKYWTPPCYADDILYVRETWDYGYFDSSGAELDNSRWFESLPLDCDRNTYIGARTGYIYRADFFRAEEYEFGTMDYRDNQRPMPWRPSIHMPREAARIFLRVTDVRVERLQDMTEDDVVDEGAEPLIQCPSEHRVWNDGGELIGMCWNEDVCSGSCDFIEKSYGELFGKVVWDSTIKPSDRDRYGWAANPWVWTIEFERCEKPEKE